ncbi:MAG: TetR/AcrR family transcriptional regulator [Pseudomonadota bacterium]
MPTQAERRSHTQRAIVEAAYRAYELEGGLDVALETIAADAGVTKGAIHYHFGNRLGLLAAVAVWVFSELETRLEQAQATRDVAVYLTALLQAQASAQGRILYTIGDTLAQAGELQPIDPFDYLRERLQGLGVAPHAQVTAAAVYQFGRQLAYGLSEPCEIDAMVGALRDSGVLDGRPRTIQPSAG